MTEVEEIPLEETTIIPSFVYTTAVKKLRKLKKRCNVVPGGTSAGKTYGIIPVLIDQAIKTSGLEISIVSESLPHLRKGAMKDFLKIMKATGRYIDKHWHRTTFTYTFANGSYIEFFSADQEDKVRGPRRNILYINECNNIIFETYHQLAIRTSLSIWLDFNPSNEFWVYQELNDDPDVEWLTLTYKDNEGLPESIVREIEKARFKAFHNIDLPDLFTESNIKSSYWANWWKVYGMGLLGSLEGVIFSNWSQIDNIPPEAKLVGSGLDFGYTNDPTALIDVYEWNGKRILDERVFRTGMVNSDIAPYCHKQTITYADSSEPKSIEEIRRLGAMIKGVRKGADSIDFGIQIMQGQNYLITSRSVNTIKEFRSYCWDTDKNGNKINKPIDAWNHCFTGDTLIETIEGKKRIDSVTTNDLVLTRNGYKRVIKRWDNGEKQTVNYLLQLDTFIVSLWCTEDHLVYTTSGWIKISQLQSGMTVCLNNPLTAKYTGYTQKSNIFQEVEAGCTLPYGSLQTNLKSQKRTMSTTSTKTHGTIHQAISKSRKRILTLLSMGSRGLKIIPNGLNPSIQKVSRKQKSGTKAMTASHGIKNTALSHGITDIQKHLNVLFAEKSTLQEILKNQSTVIKTAKLLRLDLGESRKELVYDLMVDKNHEYFANGLLVHNCIDAVRYHEMESIGHKRNFFVI